MFAIIFQDNFKKLHYGNNKFIFKTKEEASLILDWINQYRKYDGEIISNPNLKDSPKRQRARLFIIRKYLKSCFDKNGWESFERCLFT